MQNKKQKEAASRPVDGVGGENLLRVFVAIDMPASVKQEIGRIQEVLKKKHLLGRFSKEVTREVVYVQPKNAHLTMQFIGYIEAVALMPIKKLLKSVFFKPMTVELGHVGVFGKGDAMRVVWLDMVSPQPAADTRAVGFNPLTELAQRIEKALSMGTLNRKRPFQAHVTLARVRRVARSQQSDKGADKEVVKEILEEVVKNLSQVKVTPISFSVNEFLLKQSTLTRTGPIYVTLEKYRAQE